MFGYKGFSLLLPFFQIWPVLAKNIPDASAQESNQPAVKVVHIS